MPLLLENAHATAFLNRVMNLVKEAVAQLNPNQIRVLTMAQPLSATASEIQWLWSDSFCNKFVILTWEGGGGWGSVSMLRWPRQWFWIVKRSHNFWNCITWCCRIFCESILSCEDKTCPPGHSWSAACSAAFLSYVQFEPDHAVSSEQWQTQDRD